VGTRKGGSRNARKGEELKVGGEFSRIKSMLSLAHAAGNGEENLANTCGRNDLKDCKTRKRKAVGEKTG